jgi:predicted Zn-dependent protease
MNATSARRAGISPTAAVEHALKLLPSNPVLAESQAREILKVLPDDARAIFIVGAARRRAGDPAGAREVLAPLAKALPNSPYAHHELGLALAALGESTASLEALKHAAQLEPALPDVWLSLHNKFSLDGDGAAAAAAYAEHVRAALKDPILIKASEALQSNRLAEAQEILRGHLANFPGDVSALRMLGETVALLGHLDAAEEILGQCLVMAPKFVGARHNLALVLFQQNKPRTAIRELNLLLADSPGEPKYLALLAACLAYAGDYERSIETLERIIAEHPKQPRLWINYGQTLRIVNRSEDAERAIQHALVLNPTFGEAYWSLADIKTRRFSAAEVSRMRALAADATLAAEDRLNVHFALGKAFEDAGEWAESFDHYAAGAKLRREAHAYDADQNTAWTERAKAVFTPEFFRELGDGGAADPAPLLVVGLPRSGSTLLEQILAAHPQVEGTMELPHIAHLADELGLQSRKAGGPRYPEVAATLTAAARTTLGEEYIKRTLPHRILGRAYFVDKMPSNFVHIGLIRMILPQAKIIDVRRHPLGACFSAFKQHFVRGQDFTYDLTDLGRYYRDYVDLMDHYDRVLPGFVHRVIYEDLVEDTEAQVRRLLDFCGLEFDPACTRFWESKRSVATHSSEQVRRPIFRDGLDQWRHYEPWLSPLVQALGPALESWRGIDR